MVQYDDIIVTPVYGPLSTNQFPCAMPPHNLGNLIGRHPNPPMFYPSDSTSNFSNARREYMRVPNSLNTPLAQSTKYIAPCASSMLTSSRKRAAIGKTSYKIGLPDAAQLTYRSYNPNDVKTAMRITRAGGCTAPKKKGSIYNNSLRNGRACSYGINISMV